jgi:hypothetical protein
MINWAPERKFVPYRLLANIVHWCHMLLVCILVSMPLIYLTLNVGPRLQGFLEIFITATLMSQMLFLGCPLTIFEFWLRRKYDPTITDTGSFVTDLLRRKFGWEINPLVLFLILVCIFIFSVHHRLTFKSTPKPAAHRVGFSFCPAFLFINYTFAIPCKFDIICSSLFK